MTDAETTDVAETAAPTNTATVTLTPVVADAVVEPSLKEDLANLEHAVAKLAEDVFTEVKADI